MIERTANEIQPMTFQLSIESSIEEAKIILKKKLWI
jgi:hypothetical protein